VAPGADLRPAVRRRLVALGFGGSLIHNLCPSGWRHTHKGAEGGDDLVGKVEAGLPEDDHRNPAVIADNVGDKRRQRAGMG